MEQLFSEASGRNIPRAVPTNLVMEVSLRFRAGTFFFLISQACELNNLLVLLKT